MKDDSLTLLETLLMGLLSEGAVHPYRIEKEVRERDLRSWTDLSMSSIYKLLVQLEKRGLVLRQVRKGPGNRLRKLYALSPEGERLLKSKIRELLTRPVLPRFPVDTGLYYMGLLPEKEVRDALHEYRRALREQITGARQQQELLAGQGLPLHRRALALRQVYLLEAEISWINSFLGRFG